MKSQDKKLLSYFGNVCADNLRNKKRGERIFQLEKRKIKKLKEMFHSYHYSIGNMSEAEKKRISGRNAVTPKACSCYMCGNPRRWWKEITIQEKKFIIDKIDEERENKQLRIK